MGAKRHGLLLSDHLAKAYIDILKDNVIPLYNLNLSRTQFGAIAGGGTDMPCHLVQSAIAYAKFMNLCIFVLFLDLEKAFDKVLRELVFGFPHDLPSNPESKLETKI